MLAKVDRAASLFAKVLEAESKVEVARMKLRQYLAQTLFTDEEWRQYVKKTTEMRRKV